MPFGGNFHPEWGTLVPAPSLMRTARIVAVATAIGATAGAGVVLSLAGSGGAIGPLAGTDADKPLVIVHSLVQPAEAAPVAAAQPALSPAIAAAPVNVPAAGRPSANAAAAPTVAPAQTSAPVIASAPVAEPIPVRPSGEAPKGVSPFAVSASAQPETPVPSDSLAASTPAEPASVAALAEIPASTEASSATGANQMVLIPDQSGAQKTGSKKPRGADQTQQPRPQTAVATGQSPPKHRSEERGFGSLLRHLFSARSASSYPN